MWIFLRSMGYCLVGYIDALVAGWRSRKFVLTCDYSSTIWLVNAVIWLVKRCHMSKQIYDSSPPVRKSINRTYILLTFWTMTYYSCTWSKIESPTWPKPSPKHHPWKDLFGLHFHFHLLLHLKWTQEPCNVRWFGYVLGFLLVGDRRTQSLLISPPTVPDDLFSSFMSHSTVYCNIGLIMHLLK